MVYLNKSGLGIFSLLLIAVATPSMAASLSPLPAATDTSSKPHIGIAAQVGDEAISSVDVDNRMKFVISTAHMSDTPDMIARIRPQIVRSLVDEKLEMQEAKKNDITVSDKDIGDAISAIEQQRGIPPGDILKRLESEHVPKETFTQQIRAQLLWNKLLMKKIRPQVRVSDADIAMAANRLPLDSAPKDSDSGLPQEYKIAVVTLPVDKPGRENEMRHLGEKLVKEVRGGANFEEVSRQFSSSAASAGGKVEAFWIEPAQIEPHLAMALRGAKAGTVTDPVRTEQGFTIVKVYEMRDAPGAKEAAAKLAKQKAATAVATPAATVAVDEKAQKHEQVYQMLIQQKMELEAQKYLRNLRRETYIDIR